VQAANTELKLIYEGSVKRVYARSAGEQFLWFHFTDDYSVFDWGKMPDTIANKGLALTLLGAYFFERMEAKGIRTHFKRLVSEDGSTLNLKQAATSGKPVFMEVLKADVHRPECVSVLNQTVYAYPTVPPSSTQRLVPLEVVFRFGMPAGSSLKSRLEKDPDYAAQLGLSKVPADGSWFEKPVLEFFTKLEPKDRLLTVSEALAISSLNAEQFKQLCDFALQAANELFGMFKERGIELWDGKFEFIISDGQLLLADSIGPDELRLIYKNVHLSKEIIRQVYRGSSWEKSLKEAQNIARTRGTEDWKEICSNELKQQPELLPEAFKRNIDHLYGALTNHVSQQTLLGQEPDLESLVDSLSRK
jgi:phosphoribosylaminoimidazole-succinocarboxamide synthase